MHQAPDPPLPVLGEARDRPQANGRGQAKAWLRLYLGYAPGVGKTFAMLQEGRRRKARGTDVVVGWVEAYERPRTLEALSDLEIVPPRRLLYRDVLIQEMDLDGIIARRPQIALVDELAHTNVPGSRNLKRYQDVLELKALGISVISTVNVQHLTSLQDTVLLLTGIRVVETLPDWVIDAADEVEMIDQSPEALQKRVRHGNVYAKQQAQHALDNFFRLDNLTALRELTLRRMAEHTDARLQGYLAGREREPPLRSGETVLVCVPPGEQAQKLVRRGVRLADGLRARLLVVHVRAESGGGLDAETPRGHQEATRALQLARSLGAEVAVLPAADVGTALVCYARDVKATQLVVGESRRSWLRELVHGSIVRQVLRGTRDMDVHIVALADA